MNSINELRPVYVEDGKVMMIDQNLLPMELKILEITDYKMMVQAIKDMWVRGAPAIGISGAAGIYLAARENISLQNDSFLQEMERAFTELGESRPTAVNLFWALKKMRIIFDRIVLNDDFQSQNGPIKSKLVDELRCETERIADEDIKMCIAIGNYGATLIEDGDGILTHCNAGGLATGGYGTALGVIRSAHREGKKIHVYVDETRPRLQGARLTAWELDQESIPFTLISDNQAAYFMRKGVVQKAVTGADRISSNGDVANKIGTYSVAVLCKEHSIPFFVAAPFSTFDMNLTDGDQIPIEQRSSEEITEIYPPSDFYNRIKTANPAFDITSSKYVTAFFTEGGIIYPPYVSGIMNMVGKRHQE
ncbi:S-methyl-5-thioribose-1-phosphate isomerase [bacterium]|nr:S-methyl-5-thioribose-1-phosphate isomerase [bacterium]MBU1025664.1 S-methyl-5-thioribose-1-phosphate isomerase [bacterium]